MSEETSPNEPSNYNRNSSNDVLEGSSPVLNLDPSVSAEKFSSPYGNVKWTPTTPAYFSWPKPEITQELPFDWSTNMTSSERGQSYNYPAYASSPWQNFPSNDHFGYEQRNPRDRQDYEQKDPRGQRHDYEQNDPRDRRDYEQKYPRDRLGEELADNARIWLTYLDEAEAYDRDKVEGWKSTVDVLLVFAGLFSGVITTFVSQASQSLQQDNTRVSASLLFEMAQLQRAYFTGMPIIDIPSSTTSTPTSLFSVSTNAFLVNGLWFTSLAITLSTALFAVLAKQWLYYYLSSFPGTACNKARARHLRFQGFESWKVGVIIDLLPILLHLAVGIFLVGIIILLFPLDTRIAWTIVVITGTTYTLYFISVILPIRYPECPYTTSLTIYIGIVFFFFSSIFRANLKKVTYLLFLKIVYRERILYWTGLCQEWIFQWMNECNLYWNGIRGLIRRTFKLYREDIPDSVQRNERRSIAVQEYIYNTEAQQRGEKGPNSVQHFLWHLRESYKGRGFVQRAFSALRKLISLEDHPGFSNWRDENLMKSVAHAAFLDPKALKWLHTISPNLSVRRIIARAVSVYPNPLPEFKPSALEELRLTLDTEADVKDLHYACCLDLQYVDHNHHCSWSLLRSFTNARLDELEYRSYSQIADSLLASDHARILKDAVIHDPTNLKFPVIMWRYFLSQVSKDATLVGHLLASERNPFDWNSNSGRGVVYPTNMVSFLESSGELNKCIFDYLFRCFSDDAKHDFHTERPESLEKCYYLLVSIYQNFTSPRPFVTKAEVRQKSLENLFQNFGQLFSAGTSRISPKQLHAFRKDILCRNVFWNKPMTHSSRSNAAACLENMWHSYRKTHKVNHFLFGRCQDLLSVYQWCSRYFSDVSPAVFLRELSNEPESSNKSKVILVDHPVSEYRPIAPSCMILLLFMPQNHELLREILRDYPDPIPNLEKCLESLTFGYPVGGRFQRQFICPNLMRLFKSVHPGQVDGLFEVFYASSVLVQVWKSLVFHEFDEEELFSAIKSKLDQPSLENLHAVMTEEVRSVQNATPNTDRRKTRLFKSNLNVSAGRFGQTILVGMLNET